jgi:hypothetical protein
MSIQDLQPTKDSSFSSEHDQQQNELNSTALPRIVEIGEQSPALSAIDEVRTKASVGIHAFISPVLAKQFELEEKHISRIERAQLMAEWGEHYRLIPGSSLYPEILREIDFTLAKAVICLEQFQAADYRVVDHLSFESDPILARRYRHLSSFVEWAESYIDRKAPHATAVFDQDPKPLPIGLIRDLVSHNSSPLVMELHDSRHIHFSIGHPEGPALYFMAARSENIQRFALLSSLFETIDKLEFLYPFELTVRNYFREQGFTYIQDAMIFVARSSPEVIKSIVSEIQLTDVFEEKLSPHWRPSIARTDDLNSIAARLNSEVDTFVDSQRRYRINPEKARYVSYRPSRSMPDGVTELIDEDFIH